MDCIVCEAAEARPMDVRFSNGDVSHLFLCGGCVDRFELDGHVRTVDPAPAS